MVMLFLSPPASENFANEDGQALKEMIAHLQKLETIIWSVMKSGGRYEARLWLCNTISSIHSLTPPEHCDLFVELLRVNKSEHDVAAQLLQMIFEKRPDMAGSIVAKRSYMLEKFFQGNPRRILEWFDHFATVGESGHRKGARALSKFAFMNRDTCWEELEWKGRHGQSPAVVATKPHYFHDLDVLMTVENFLEYVPDFWSSEELAESVKDGEILNIDQKYFINKFLQLMYVENLEELWDIIEEFIMGEQFSCLCQHLLIILDEPRMLHFLKSISKFILVNANCKELRYPSCWLENLLSTCSDSVSVDELILVNAVISHGRRLLRLIIDEEYEEEKQKLNELLRNEFKFCDTDHWALMKECLKMKKEMAVKYVGLQSWILHYHLALERKSQHSYETLFTVNGISFRRADDFSLVQDHGSELDEVLYLRHNKKRKRDKKRMKKKNNHKDENADEILVFDSSKGLHDWKSGDRSWLLSTDDFSCAWNAVDLPEHLSKFCFWTWMRWVLSKW
ncbi:hypothetical protein AXF42_Ash001380 [Apostasia shenzhenica]|uniref:Uncharacterized protein n=1 Tax=Apostasia shenzhenica TaxID=1088818 RepID=A0A2I0AUW5_9ASPA|nr:hypothetical protein AXF42_Ash001380 [Apostasia shenzhenica]